MDSVDIDNSYNREEHVDDGVTDGFESTSVIPKADGIDYLRDVNIAVQDIIDLLRTTLRTLERSLSRHSDSASSSPEDDPAAFTLGELSECRPGRSGSDDAVPKDLSEAAGHFLTKLRSLIDYTENRINVSPIQQQELDRKLRHAVRSSRKTEMEIKSLEDALSVQRTEHQKAVDKLKEELNECINAGNRRAEEIENEIRRIVNESEMKMVAFYKESVARQELLDSEIKIAETRLKNLRGGNILRENELRDKRRGVENQLLDYLAKYDEDIGGRHEDMENFSREFELLNHQRKTLEIDVMVDLRTTHDDLQREKAEALQKILDERVDKYVRNRAAKVIQKAWRAYWERHCAKKKKKSRKK